jgi:hypothetical protein
MRKCLLLLTAACLKCCCGLALGGDIVLPGKPLFSFGAIADIHYADKDSLGKRLYRTTPAKLEESVTNFNGSSLAFAVQLGDFVDGQSAKAATVIDFQKALAIWKKLNMPAYSVIGNNCLEFLDNETLRSSFNLKKFYYDFTLPACPGWRFIVLDGKHLDNGPRHMQWFTERLKLCRDEGSRAIVFCHYPLVEAASRKHRLKEPRPVLDIIEKAGCVAAYIAGHDHDGGYAFTNGTHHITVKGMVESGTGTSYAIFHVYPDRILEAGFGLEPDRDLKLK